MKTDLNGQWHYLSIVHAAKTYLSNSWVLNCLLFILTINLSAQTGSLKITVADKKTKEAIPFANALVIKEGKQVASGMADFDGYIVVKSLTPGKYQVKVMYVGYLTTVFNDVVVMPDKVTYLNVKLSDEGVKLDIVEVMEYKVPLIDADTKSGATFSRQNFQQMSSKSINSVVSTSAGVYQQDNSNVIYNRGSRSSSTNVFIDGERAIGTSNIPQSAVTQVQPVLGGVPAQYGTVSSGVVSVSTPTTNLIDKQAGTGLPAELKAGVLTAGEINDFKKWDLWTEMGNENLAQYHTTWKMTPSERYTVMALNENKRPLIDVLVTLYSKEDKILWKARTDNTGKAELWLNLFETNDKASYYEVDVAGKKTRGDKLKKFGEGINFCQVKTPCAETEKLDVLFMVDATSSMDDEINYLKTELYDILTKTKSDEKKLSVRTGSLFYRCKGNAYVTRRSAFGSDVNTTIDFIKEQNSGEGGLEAVEVALEEAVNDFQWSEGQATRLLFIVLDEPPGNTYDIVEQLHRSIAAAAEKGIRIIPLVASGGTSDVFSSKSMEYLMRSMALATNGTYAFLTDHSGVGDAHVKPTTDEYDVELLNKMILRIIKQFSVSTPCNAEQIMPDLVKDTTVVAIAHEVLAATTKKHKKSVEPVVNRDSLPEKDSINYGNNEKKSMKIDKAFKFYPNPTRGKVFIETEGKVEDVYLSDVNGKLMEKFSVEKGGNEIDISNYAEGEYILQFMNEGKWKGGKLILLRN